MGGLTHPEFEAFEGFKYGVSVAWVQCDFLHCVTIDSNAHLFVA